MKERRNAICVKQHELGGVRLRINTTKERRRELPPIHGMTLSHDASSFPNLRIYEDREGGGKRGQAFVVFPDIFKRGVMGTKKGRLPWGKLIHLSKTARASPKH